MGLKNMLAYPQDTILGFWFYSIYIFIYILLIIAVFNVAGIDQLAGWNLWQIMLVMTMAEVVWAFMFTFIWDNVRMTTREFHTGRLDFDLTKPINIKFVMSCRRISPLNLIHLLFYVFLGNYFISRAGLEFNSTDWIMFGLIIFFSLIIIFLIAWNINLITFISERTNAIWEFFLNVTHINNYPKKIYPGAMRSFFVFILPIFLVANPLYDLMAGEMSWSDLDFIVLMMILMLMIYFNMWLIGLRKYTSAN